ncbi:hypothetical protein C8C83_1288 [Flavobacterium sp. 90]|uniref:hypothetical protein n=1 Tax=unclassified Flavobacterium TaxID=196869 RepID=UPI000EB2EE32|nr:MULTISPECIES: hypothetical protein [unclassified Flavobacterium]RKR09645.1 hypothetical protein C8C82_1589 [Flavobacterium sp. 81]TCK53429.1 hypothetical protein C8C83_1288 [Flavobacterium sp. 90]
MKKKFITSSIVVIIIVIAFIYFKYIFGWLEFRHKNYTLKEFKSVVHVSKERYSIDSLNLVLCIKDKIIKHQDPYYNAVRVNDKLIYINDSLTKIYIDTILCSKNLKRVAFLVIVKNDFFKIHKDLLKLDSNYLNDSGVLPRDGQEFNGRCFLAERKDENNSFESIRSFSRYSFNDSSSFKNVSNQLREISFSFERESDSDSRTYNVDDIRFWESDIWRK